MKDVCMCLDLGDHIQDQDRGPQCLHRLPVWLPVSRPPPVLQILTNLYSPVATTATQTRKSHHPYFPLWLAPPQLSAPVGHRYVFCSHSFILSIKSYKWNHVVCRLCHWLLPLRAMPLRFIHVVAVSIVQTSSGQSSTSLSKWRTFGVLQALGNYEKSHFKHLCAS